MLCGLHYFDILTSMKSILILLIITTQTLFGLISIAPVEIGEKPGIHGKVSTSLQTRRGSTKKENYKAALRIAYDNNSTHVTWTELSAEYGETNNVENTNRLYMHIRHIYALTQEALRGELLAQLQRDKFKLIRERAIAGAGVRAKAFELLESSKGYLGVGGFYESINYTSDDKTENQVRINSYFTYTAGFNKDSSLSYTLYYQPIADDFNDYIQSHKFQLKLHVFKELSLNFRLSYDVDSKPPVGINKYDFYQETSFVFEF